MSNRQRPPGSWLVPFTMAGLGAWCAIGGAMFHMPLAFGFGVGALLVGLVMLAWP